MRRFCLEVPGFTLSSVMMRRTYLAFVSFLAYNPEYLEFSKDFLYANDLSGGWQPCGGCWLRKVSCIDVLAQAGLEG